MKPIRKKDGSKCFEEKEFSGKTDNWAQLSYAISLGIILLALYIPSKSAPLTQAQVVLLLTVFAWLLIILLSITAFHRTIISQIEVRTVNVTTDPPKDPSPPSTGLGVQGKRLTFLRPIVISLVILVFSEVYVSGIWKPDPTDILLLIGLINGLILGFVVSWYTLRSQEYFSEECSFLAPFVNPEACSKIQLPLTCRLGNSHNLSALFELAPIHKDPPKLLESDSLEVELRAAGLTISGDLKQRQPLANGTAKYMWSCNFSTAGKHVINLIYRLVDQSNTATQDLGTTTFEVQVVKLYRQYSLSIVATALTIISLILARSADLQGVLHSFGLL